MRRFYLSLFVVIALLLTACGNKKEESQSSRLPQVVSILDGGLTFRLPEDWMTRTSPELSTTVTFYNTEDILKFHPYPENLPIAQRAFSDPLPDTLSRLGVEQNLVVGALMVTAQDKEFSGQSPSEIVQAAFEGAGYTFEASEIKTFENGAWAYYRPEESDLYGIVGVVKDGDSIAAMIIATDKLEEYQSTFEDIVRSIHLNPDQIPTPTPEAVPTIAPTQPQ
jgi:hypothetical protein